MIIYSSLTLGQILRYECIGAVSAAQAGSPPSGLGCGSPVVLLGWAGGWVGAGPHRPGPSGPGP